MKAVWDSFVAGAKRIGHIMLGPVGALVLIAIAILLTLAGFRNLQIGGILGWLLGKKRPSDTVIDVANSIPEDRVDPKGKLIPIGTPDEHGMTQAVVVPIHSTGLFSDPDTVKFTPPGKDTIEVQLPTGVKAKDVAQVVVVHPGNFVVTVKDSSGVKAKDVSDLLAKLRK